MARDNGYFTDRRFVRRISADVYNLSRANWYPYNIPAIRNLGTLELHEHVTFFVGENGTGKSTLIEAIAVKTGFPSGGGTPHKYLNDEGRLVPYIGTYGNGADLAAGLNVDKTVRCKGLTGFFLRAESFYNVATEVEATAEEKGARVFLPVGGQSLHKVSHGESFLALIANQFEGGGLFVLDEPEAALSPNRLLVLLGLIDTLARRQRSQFIIATHSPILLAYPYATIYELSSTGIRSVEYEETEHYRVTLDFLRNHESYVSRLCGDRQDD